MKRLSLLVAAAAVIVAPVAGMDAAAAERPTATAAAKKKKCHPNYKGQCLKRNASDYDCAGGSGDGPYYVRGTVRVVGADPFDLDRDGDGIGCDS